MTAQPQPRHFWASSGHVLLEHDPAGGLVVTDEFLKAYLARKEVLPPEDACSAEVALHASLLAEPRRPVSASEIAAMADPDARENWAFLIAFRDRLIAAPTVEAAYLQLVRDNGGGVPPLFMQQLVHVILRNALNTCDDPFIARAAEVFYRTQRATVKDGTILLADADVIELHEEERHASPLMAMMGEAAVTGLDILKAGNADRYWQRSDAFDMVLDLGGKPTGRAALAGAIALWINHLTGTGVSVTPLERIEDGDWRWFIGLDSEATMIGNALWRGEAVDPDRLARVIGLFSLTFPPGAPVLDSAAGRPVYLILAMTEDTHVRMKPHNLIAGLPLKEPA